MVHSLSVTALYARPYTPYTLYLRGSSRLPAAKVGADNCDYEYARVWSTVDSRRSIIDEFTRIQQPGSAGLGALHPMEVSGAAARFQTSAMSENTRRGYASDWARFVRYADDAGLASLPASPTTVANYLAASAELVDERGAPVFRPATLKRWVAAINHAHFLAGFDKPGVQAEVKTTLAGISREYGAPQRRMRPLVLSDLRKVLATIDRRSWPHGIAGHRDYLILLMGFAGAFRRSELAGFNVGDISQHTQDGLHSLIRSSKTDQEAEGLITALPFGTSPDTCVPCAHARWVRHLSLAHTPRPERMQALFATESGHACGAPLPSVDPASALFRPVVHSVIAERRISNFVVHDVVRRRLRDAEFEWEKYGGHSLRSGFITEAFRQGRSHHEIMRQTHHKSYAMLELYSRENDPLRHNAVTSLGL